MPEGSYLHFRGNVEELLGTDDLVLGGLRDQQWKLRAASKQDMTFKPCD